jgi:diacylglycerol kinase
VEINFTIQLFIAGIISAAIFIFPLAKWEIGILILCIGIMLALEMLNTAIEQLANIVTPEFHIGIKKVKDIAAGAALLFAIVCVAIGMLVFLPKIYMFI